MLRVVNHNTNKKAFTLVELLAVIVILAIILIIAVPRINNVIDDSRKGTFKSTNAMIERTVKGQATIDSLEVGAIIPKTYTFSDGVISPELETT